MVVADLSRDFNGSAVMIEKLRSDGDRRYAWGGNVRRLSASPAARGQEERKEAENESESERKEAVSLRLRQTQAGGAKGSSGGGAKFLTPTFFLPHQVADAPSASARAP